MAASLRSSDIVWTVSYVLMCYAAPIYWICGQSLKIRLHEFCHTIHWHWTARSILFSEDHETELELLSWHSETRQTSSIHITLRVSLEMRVTQNFWQIFALSSSHWPDRRSFLTDQLTTHILNMFHSFCSLGGKGSKLMILSKICNVVKD